MAGEVTQAVTTVVDPVKVVTLTCTADSSDGSYPATAQVFQAMPRVVDCYR